ncbi:MAG TPA: polysaccharide deacetylase family protein [Hyphomonadaceae bacterium]|nr:polysaccharide deacetylase family protein [Hyphomonadaceae bacterium]
MLNDQTRLLVKRVIISSGLEVTSVLSALGMFGGARGKGAIFTLHHVRPRPDAQFQPNDLLDVTPGFLDAALTTLKNEGYAFIPLAEVPGRLAEKTGRPFACFTLDDGYRDNAAFAADVFGRHQAPFTIFLNSGFVDRSCTMWWETLAAVLNHTTSVEFDFGAGRERLAADTPAQKLSAFNRIAGHINTGDERAAVAQLDDEATRLGIDPQRIVAGLTMAEEELKALAANPLVSYGAHTVSHRGIARLAPEDAEAEIAGSIDAITAITGRAPITFAYPYGDRRSWAPREQQTLRRHGIDIALTTRPGTLRPEMAADMTALPRISLNGLYQKDRYVRALASGIPFRMTA